MRRWAVAIAVVLSGGWARAADLVVADFEGDTYGPGWVTTGTAFGTGPAHGPLPGQYAVDGYVGRGFADSFHGTDRATGTLTSPPFAVGRDFINLLVGGGGAPGRTCVNLVVDGTVVRTATGGDTEHLYPVTWDVRPLRGRSARVQLVDAATGGYGHLNVDQIMQSDTPADPDVLHPAAVYRERYRPQFHFSPKKGWMNDPNGLMFFDGEWHLFYQHDPDSLPQTPLMSWGHAVSPDLAHWTELPIAIRPDASGSCWSGSAVVDWQNSSGFGVGGRPPLVLMYTAAKDPFSQFLAYSTDRGRTWARYDHNPVIGHIAASNRDPHLIWHGPTKQWLVVLYKDVPDTFCLFASADLKHWTHLQDLHMPGCSECPDFFPLKLDGGAERWVFTAANGHYLVGAFDGRQFAPEQAVRQVDYGKNFYAVQTFSDVPPADGRRVQIAWMQRGHYPHMPFNQQMSFPAELTLHTTPDGPRLFRQPVREIDSLHAKEHRWTDLAVTGETPLGVPGDLFDVRAEVDVGTAAEVGFTVGGEPVTYSVKDQTLTGLGTAPLPLTDGRLSLRLLVDRTSIETFADGGRVSLSGCFLPKTTGLTAFARGGTAHVRSLVVTELKSAWPNP